MIPESLSPVAILPILLLLSLGLGRLLAGPLASIPVHSSLERGLIYWLLGVVAFSWVGVILAGLGLFYWWSVLISLALLIIMVHRTRQILPAGSAAAPLPQTPLPVMLLVGVGLIGAAWLFARPAESFFLSDDATVYNIGGIVLARTGSLFAQPESTGTTSMDFVRQFFHIANSGEPTRFYMPFYQWTLKQSTIEIGFLPLTKVWTALVVWLFGEGYSTWATPFFGLTGLAALYGLTRRSLGWVAGLAALLLATVSLPQIWFAREPVSEIYTQAFLLGGLYLAVMTRQNALSPNTGRRLAVWSGLAFAALTILRFEGSAVLVALVILLLLAWQRSMPGELRLKMTWLLTLGIAGGVGLMLTVLVARHYFFTATLFAITPELIPPVLAGLLIALAAGGWLWYSWPRQADRLRAWLEILVKVVPWLILVGWIMWVAISLWRMTSTDWHTTVAGWLAQYWTWSALALSVTGSGWLLWKARWRTNYPEVITLLGLALAFLLLFSLRAYVTPAHPWAVRRLVPAVMPALAIGLAALWAAGVNAAQGAMLRRPQRGMVAWLAIILLTVALVIQIVAVGQISYPFWTHREMAGLWSQLQAVFRSIPANAVLLFDDGDVGRGLAPTAGLLFDRLSLNVYGTPAAERPSELDGLIESAVSQQRPVFLIITNGNLAWQPERWQLTPQTPISLIIPVLRHTTGQLPTSADIVSRTMWLDVYQITSGPGAMTLPETSLIINGGAGSYPYLRRGFYQWDLGVDNAIARWTMAEGQIVAPWPASQVEAPATFCLKINAAGGRPVDQPEARLTVEVEGRDLFSAQLSRDYRPSQLAIPVKELINRDSPQLEVNLRTNTWDAASVGDARDLGVLFYSLQIEPFEQCAN